MSLRQRIKNEIGEQCSYFIRLLEELKSKSWETDKSSRTRAKRNNTEKTKLTMNKITAKGVEIELLSSKVRKNQERQMVINNLKEEIDQVDENLRKLYIEYESIHRNLSNVLYKHSQTIKQLQTSKRIEVDEIINYSQHVAGTNYAPNSFREGEVGQNIRPPFPQHYEWGSSLLYKSNEKKEKERILKSEKKEDKDVDMDYVSTMNDEVVINQTVMERLMKEEDDDGDDEMKDDGERIDIFDD